jgi:transcriptional regulator with XRE-family HTH domain
MKKPPSPGDEDTEMDIDVGRSLRQLRGETRLSLRALAKKSGLAINTLCLIENGKTSPSVSTLQRLALGLEVPITAFFETNVPDQTEVFLRQGQRGRVSFAHGTVEDLGGGLMRSSVEPMLITLVPQADSGPSVIVHTGAELVYCLAGKIEYCIEDRRYVLEPGDSLLFEAHLEHCWHNAGPDPAQALLVLCPSDEHDRPTDRHFALRKETAVLAERY